MVKRIQRNMRRFLSTLRLRRTRRAAVCAIQKCWRGFRSRTARPDAMSFLAQRRLQRTRESHVRRLFAAFQARQLSLRFRELRGATRTLQLHANASLYRHQFHTIRGAALVLQKAVRAFLAVRRLGRLRAQRVAQMQRWRVHVLRERELLELSNYNHWLESPSLWSTLAAQTRSASVQFTKLVDVDAARDISDSFPSGIMRAIHRLQRHLILKKGERVQQLTCGDNHIVVVSSKGDVFAWGMGQSGQLGLGDFAFQKVIIWTGLTWTHIRIIYNDAY